MSWSGMRSKLEKDYLAESLRGHIQYFCTSYNKAHDHYGRASIRLDGKELIRGCHFNRWLKRDQFPQNDSPEALLYLSSVSADETTLELGLFDEGNFYAAFEEFDNQSIEKSLNSENLIVRIFAILDRRVGKRRLLAMREQVSEEDKIFHTFYTIRMNAEGL